MKNTHIGGATWSGRLDERGPEDEGREAGGFHFLTGSCESRFPILTAKVGTLLGTTSGVHSCTLKVQENCLVSAMITWMNNLSYLRRDCRKRGWPGRECDARMLGVLSGQIREGSLSGQGP